MPPLVALLPTIAAVAGLAGTGVSLGLDLSNQPGTPKPATPTPAQTAATDAATQTQQRELVSQQLPNVLSSTSGLANPDYTAQIIQLLSGTTGQAGSTGAAQQAVNSAFGITPAVKKYTPAGADPNTSAASSPSSPISLSEFVKAYI